MKKVELTRATDSLEKYARELGQEPLVLTDGGHAIAALLPVDDDVVESMALSLSPKFQAIIERARSEYACGASLPAEGARRKLSAPESDGH